MEEEEVPRGDDPDDETEIDQSTDENQPPIDELPQTGDSSPVPYYLLGSFMAVTGLVALRKRRRQN
ncbi:LPXTG cell wall anchor domain-containing protein [Paenibacillus soyae]|uniref:LPXTG cell wall anchor domain-containing protein n=1 Tax=Paenibacillus soyae TaxID=2969249 RepID=A0A9X2MUH2_9BACL|nr:LPXTG cell wall anchor domain-containing protein [Paenibacillus soyae]